MNAQPAESMGWSRRRWSWIIAGGVMAHVGLIFWLGERAEPVEALSPPSPLLKMVAGPDLSQSGLRFAGWTDPTLFALPSPDGFSGSAWLSIPPSSPPQDEWSEPPRWLPLDTNELGAVFLHFVTASKPNSSVVDEMLKMRATAADILLLYDAQMTQSVARIAGPLAQRPLVSSLAVPNPAFADVLPDTVIQVRVNLDGITESVILLDGCGVKSVDEQALAVAAAARFQPRSKPADSPPPDPPPPTWGKIVFQWLTVPPAATNATAVN
jgi:hypothetical protein